MIRYLLPPPSLAGHFLNGSVHYATAIVDHAEVLARELFAPLHGSELKPTQLKSRYLAVPIWCRRGSYSVCQVEEVRKQKRPSARPVFRRIDSRFLLPARDWLPHVNCYPAAAVCNAEELSHFTAVKMSHPGLVLSSLLSEILNV